ncbi:MAG: putative glycolipid-binding domain-containing protein [Verrucomicrobia bacterium]|nr:putative glycolipid-binding domain-containing protein [Verrucomicrobiota bacterium]
MSLLTPQALCWRRILDDNSLEYAAAKQLAAGLELAGTIVAIHDELPLAVRYRIECDADWRTRTVWIEQRLGLQQSSLSLSVDPGGAWNDQRGGLIHSVTGCLDVDLEMTPITNSLPVNRLNLAIGQVEEIAVAWIRFPSLEIVRASQSYERLSDRKYRYRSLGSGFTAEIDVDEIGLTVRYEGIWERVALSGT